jgi:hypothetical protein
MENISNDMSNVLQEIVDEIPASPSPTWRPPAHDSDPPPIRRQHAYRNPPQFQAHFNVDVDVPRCLDFYDFEEKA